MKYQPILPICALLLLALLHPHPSHSHNGAVAIAVPVEGIVVDGDLSDWPEGTTRYEIELCEYGDAPRDSLDFQGSFRVGYNSEENALYIAVEVRDESTVIDTMLQVHWAQWWEIQDGCEVYVDIKHREIDSPVVQCAIYGNKPRVLGEFEMQRMGHRYWYEWKIDVAQIITAFPYMKLSEERKLLRAGMTLGFDVSICDKDEDGSFSWMVWGRGGNKIRITNGRGNVLLSEKDEFITYSEGLRQKEIRVIAEDKQGHLWIGTYKGVYQFDGKQFTKLVFEEDLALADVPINAILEYRDGSIWFGTQGEGVSRYDGEELITFTTEDNLPHNVIVSMLQDRAGNLWCGTGGGGLSRFDGQKFTNFTIDNGLAGLYVIDMIQGQDGHLWLGTEGGVSRYDGREFTNFTTDDGLAHNIVTSVLEDHQGHLWFGTVEGVSRYDGNGFTNFTSEDDLAGNRIVDLLEDRNGILWFCFSEARLNLYDGLVFQTLSQQDGFIAGLFTQLIQDRRGDIWIGTNHGLIRHRPKPTPPLISLTHIMADRKYGSVDHIEFSTSQQYIAFEFQGSSYRTLADQIVYVYRLEGFDANWQKTQGNRVEYTDLPRGEYVFQVKSVDRDLSYSKKPATVRLSIHLPYGQIVLWIGIGLALTILTFVSGYAIKKRRALFAEMEEELQTAHDMQMGLMPKDSPDIKGFDISGRCLPANHVGGDFFQYFPISDNRLAISLADVTGHAMEAAVPVMMFSGILDTQMETGDNLEDLFERLNRSLHRNLDKRTFVCFAMGELDTATKRFRFSNGGSPYPYHFKAASGDISELQVDAYPLGVRAEATYPVIEAQLDPGDRIVFCSDGIIEAENSEEEMFGFERTAETIRSGCNSDLSAPQLLDYLINEVKTFAGETPQGDDQTVVVLQVES